MMTSLRSCARSPSGGTPPIHIPFFFEAAILSRMRSPMTSRSNCAKDNRTFRVKCPSELVVLNCCVTETKDAPLVSRMGRFAGSAHRLELPALRRAIARDERAARRLRPWDAILFCRYGLVGRSRAVALCWTEPGDLLTVGVVS